MPTGSKSTQGEKSPIGFMAKYLFPALQGVALFPRFPIMPLRCHFEDNTNLWLSLELKIELNRAILIEYTLVLK